MLGQYFENVQLYGEQSNAPYRGAGIYWLTLRGTCCDLLLHGMVQIMDVVCVLVPSTG